jgi:endonuclease YncB( thermonuclease family)
MNLAGRRRAARTAVVAACGVLALAAAGCGSSGSGGGIQPAAAQAIRTAATTSTGAQGYKLNLSMKISSPALPTAITATGNGAFSPRNRTGTMTIDMNLANIPGAAQQLGSSDMKMNEVIDGTTFYVQLPAFLASKLPGGKPWMKIDLAKAGAAAGIPGFSSLLGGSSQNDPSQFLQYLRAAGGSVTTVGSERINGVSTTHYQTAINLDRVGSQLPSASRAAAQQAISSMEKLTGLHSIPVDVWIDGSHLVRRMSISFTEHVGGQALALQMQIDIPEYGPQPAPTVPPADQVGDLTAMLGSSLSGVAGAPGGTASSGGG